MHTQYLVTQNQNTISAVTLVGICMNVIRWLMSHEYARTAEDVRRRTKLELRLNEDEIASLNQWMQTACA